MISTIKLLLTSLKEELKGLLSQSSIVYSAQPVIAVVNRIIDLIEKQGIPDVQAIIIQGTDLATSVQLNKLSLSLNKALVAATRILDELSTKLLDITQKYADKVNIIEPIIKDLQQRMLDIEKQTLEKVTNTSIYEHEIKNINFSNNVLQTSLHVIDNLLMLNPESSENLVVNDVQFTILGPNNATRKLNASIDSQSNKTDVDTVIGSYFGNLIGMLDGTTAYRSDKSFSVEALFNTNIDDILDINYYDETDRNKFVVSMDIVFRSPRTFNMIEIASNAKTSIAIHNMERMTNLAARGSVWPHKITTDKIQLTFECKLPEKLKYQAIDILDSETNAIVTRENFFSSLAYMFPEIMHDLNDSIVTSKIQPKQGQYISLTKRSGFYKYNINIAGILIISNTYQLTGQWESDLIVTNKPIYSVEVFSDSVVPDNSPNAITYQISFDKSQWYDIRPTNDGLTEDNFDKRKRIVLSGDNLDPDFLYIGKQTQNLGVYLRVNMKTTKSSESPVIYRLELRIKVADNV